jgi:hypothetical protein
MNRQQTWFTRQLEAAAKEAQNLPSWARQEAGLKVLSPPETSARGTNAASHVTPSESSRPTTATDK